VCLWDEAGSRLAHKLPVPDRVYTVATRGHWIVVGCAERQISIYDVRVVDRPFRVQLSPLKFMTRAIEVAPNGTWFGVTSIEGRCAVVHFDESVRESADFSFKCHRQGDDVYPVNDISFHPNGTFLTVGNDNCLPIWDKESRSRLRHSSLPAGPGTVRGRFSPNGEMMAIALAYDWSQGPSKYDRSPGHVVIAPSGNIERRPPRNR